MSAPINNVRSEREVRKMTSAERVKKWRAENPEAARRQTAEAMRRLRERNRRNAAAYRERNPEKARQSRRKSDAKRRGSVVQVKPKPVVTRKYERPESSTLAERFTAWRNRL